VINRLFRMAIEAAVVVACAYLLIVWVLPS
jgi:hypothetical protein